MVKNVCEFLFFKQNKEYLTAFILLCDSSLLFIDVMTSADAMAYMIIHNP